MPARTPSRPGLALALAPLPAQSALGRQFESEIVTDISIARGRHLPRVLGGLPDLVPGGATPDDPMILSSPASHDRALQERLWQVSEQHTGATFARPG